MNFLADLHIHSPFSRATSPSGTLAGLKAWAQVKGINLLGTGDFTHPGWFRQIKEQLLEAEPGLFRLRDEQVAPALPGVNPDGIPVRFLLSAEISSIYKRHGQVRKVHNLLYVPDLAAAERVNAKLAGIGNIEADGRPILGLDSRDLLEILLEASPDGFLVPAHIWTPWFSLFGSKSGFDRIEDCFGDLTPEIFALETGLSSDPAMNRLVSALDRFTLISNSDCHSPSKLGREVNLFSTDFEYFALRAALKNPSAGGFGGTIEFYPEEGKYHADGHRNCQVCLEPPAAKALDCRCPVCGRPLTIGVSHRVLELADRTTPSYRPGEPGFTSTIPLPEVLGELLERGPSSQAVTNLYVTLINQFGSEFTLLRQTPEEELRNFSPLLGEAIARIRRDQVIRQPGYDGEFGRIRLFAEGERHELAGQGSLFVQPRKKDKKRLDPAPLIGQLPPGPVNSGRPAAALNPEQLAAATTIAPRLLVMAGPGTGKTHTLVERVVHLVGERAVPPAAIAAITFTNRAAAEIENRLAGKGMTGVFVGTFHRLCLEWLRSEEPELLVLGSEERALLLKQLFPELKKGELGQLAAEIDQYYQQLAGGSEPTAAGTRVESYLAALAARQLLDLEGVIPFFRQRLGSAPALLATVRRKIRFLLVDEFQDLNQAQYDLVQLLAAEAELFAIGDPNQAIYGFRGSDLAFFFRLAELADERGQTKVITLTKNYRSGATILTAAAALIAHNRQESAATLQPQAPLNGRIEHFQAATPQAEAEYVVQRIEEIMGGVSNFSINSGRGGSRERTRSFADIAILYRLKSQAEFLQTALARRGIPIQVVGGEPFFMCDGLQYLQAFLQAAAGTATLADHLELSRGVGLGAAALAKLEYLPLRTRDFFVAAGQCNLGPQPLAKLKILKNELGNFRQALASQPLAALLPSYAALFKLQDNAASQRFYDLAGVFGTDLLGFANHLRAHAALSVYDPRAEAVALLTLHAAKGMEFPVVFICGVEEGIIPHTPAGRPADLEEERRLFYVGLTRAKEHLLLTAAATRPRHGQTETMRPSSFLAELPAHLLTLCQPARVAKRPSIPEQLSLF